MNYVLNTFIPVLEAELTSITIPGTKGGKDGIDYSISDITCHTFTIASSTITTDPSSGITLNLNDLNLACSANWNFKRHVSP